MANGGKKILLSGVDRLDCIQVLENFLPLGHIPQHMPPTPIWKELQQKVIQKPTFIYNSKQLIYVHLDASFTHYII